MRRWLITAAVVAAVVGAGVLAWSVVPPIVSAAMTHTAETDETVVLLSGTADATVAVPAGWSVHPAFNDASRVGLSSPDGEMTVQFALTTATDAAATARALVSDPLGDEVREPDGAGRELVHARTTAGDTVAGSLDGGDVAVAFSSTPSPGYDAELAHLLDGIAFPP